MSSHTSLLRQTEHQKSLNARIEMCCQIARELEEEGDLTGARDALFEVWNGPGTRPDLMDLSKSTAAEVLLLAGRLTSRLSGGAQGEAKDLISEAMHQFDSKPYIKKAAEARKELALCYWREDATDTARILLNEALEMLGTNDSELKARIVHCTAIVEYCTKRYHEALRILTTYTPLFQKVNSHLVKGSFNNDFGNVLMCVARTAHSADYRDRAIEKFTAAAYHFEKSGHRQYRAIVENNLGLLYSDVGQHEEAHAHLKLARRILNSLRDRITVAMVDDSRARVLLAEGKNKEAERIARSAVQVQERGDRAVLLAEALTTHATALARLGLYEHGRFAFLRAMRVAESQDAREHAGTAALAMLEEMQGQMSGTELSSIYFRADELLERAEPHLIERLRRCARLILSVGRVEEPQRALAVNGASLQEAVEQYEKECIKKALAHTQGRVSHAARLLGLNHQSLTYMLQTRHQDLLAARTPAKPRTGKREPVMQS